MIVSPLSSAFNFPSLIERKLEVYNKQHKGNSLNSYLILLGSLSVLCKQMLVLNKDAHIH